MLPHAALRRGLVGPRNLHAQIRVCASADPYSLRETLWVLGSMPGQGFNDLNLWGTGNDSHSKFLSQRAESQGVRHGNEDVST